MPTNPTASAVEIREMVASEVETVSRAIYEFLSERFPEGALPGGVQLFADPGDHLDAEFKHEAGCDALARAILNALSASKDTEIARLREALERIVTLAASGKTKISDDEWTHGCTAGWNAAAGIARTALEKSNG
jgi:hypothetical protein